MEGPRHELEKCLVAVESLRGDFRSCISRIESSLERHIMEDREALSSLNKGMIEVMDIVRGDYGEPSLVRDVQFLQQEIGTLKEERVRGFSWKQGIFLVILSAIAGVAGSIALHIVGIPA